MKYGRRSEREREAVGLIVSRATRGAAQKPLDEHLRAFLDDVKAKGRTQTTTTHYRKLLAKLFARCGWRTFRDITARSFCDWRARSGLSPKFVNDVLGTAVTFLRWLERQEPGLGNPLRDVGKATNDQVGAYRRALSTDEVSRLLSTAPPSRSWVYLVVLYTGLRRNELNQLTWGDFNLDGPQPTVSLSARITKNRKSAVIYLRPEVVEALRRNLPANAAQSGRVFRGRVPSVAKLKIDLEAAGIPYLDKRGRRVDLHALRTTFGTMLSAAGVPPRVAMELMRHSDLKLTMRIYTDAAQLPLATEVRRLPSFWLPNQKPSELARP